MTEKTTPVQLIHGLTQEQWDALAAPVPAEHIKVIPGSDIRYTSDKWVMSRLNAVVGRGGWSEGPYINVLYPRPVVVTNKDGKVLKTFVGTVSGTLTIGDVTHAATIDTEVETGMYGTPGTNGQSTCFKRMAMKFGVASELWMDEAGNKPVRGAYSQPASTGTTQYAQPTNGAIKLASDKQKDMLFDGFFVPKNVSALLTGGSYDPNAVVEDGQPRMGQASRLFSELREAKSKNSDYASNANYYIHQALEAIKPEAAKLVPAGVAPADDFDDPD
jgi:hypothetical protein